MSQKYQHKKIAQKVPDQNPAPNTSRVVGLSYLEQYRKLKQNQQSEHVSLNVLKPDHVDDVKEKINQDI